MALTTSNKFNKFFISIFFIIGICSCDSDSEIITNNNSTNTPVKETTLKDISYGPETEQVFDFYLPDSRSINTKILILVHGGAWVSGDKAELDDFVTPLQTSFPDYAVANLNYQLASVSKKAFPMQLNDIKLFIEYLKSNNEQYQIGNQIAFIGVSAGAHLSMLYSYKYDHSLNVNLVASIVGPTNFTDINYIEDANYSNFSQAIQLLTGVNYMDNPTYYEELSPYHIIQDNAPPTVLFYGGKDDLIPTSQGVDMKNKLDDLDIPNEFILYKNEGHGWEGTNLIDTKEKLIDFIKEHF